MYVLKSKGYSLRAIAAAVGRSVSTISDELRRNAVAGSYTPAKAHHKAYVRRRESKFQGKKIVEHRQLRNFIEQQLLHLQSPAAVSGRLATGRDGLPYVSRDTVETYLRSVYGRQIEYQLAILKREHKYRRKKRLLLTTLQDRTFIVSGKHGTGYLHTVVDRMLRTGFIRQILPVSILTVEQAFLDIQKQFPELRSITTDNDILFRRHKRLGMLLGNIPIYFCHPYHSWEKGTVENYNKQVRRYVKKGADISEYTPEYVAFVEGRLNSRFMSVIGYQTPAECLEEHRRNTEGSVQENIPLTRDV